VEQPKLEAAVALAFTGDRLRHTTGGIPSNGGEGFRFLGYPAYDALIN
jgi:hypothetical protein